MHDISPTLETVPKSIPKLVVGIGSSAGGLLALETFFDAMPDDSHIAFVVIQHLSPDFDSHLDDLLQKYTRMKVKFAENGDWMEPNRVYLAPPKRNVSVYGGFLHLEETDEVSPLPFSIDRFFESLADGLGAASAGIIFSGSGTDGTLGLEAIHLAGGLTLAQDGESAEFDSMPISAQTSGHCDHILRPEEMPAILIDHAKTCKTSRKVMEPPLDESEITAVSSILYQTYNVDFSKYKEATIARRIVRRMEQIHAESFQQYIERLTKDKTELEVLFSDLLIGVTEFFRDPESFSFIQNGMLPHIFDTAGEDGVRFWVAGCSTGEEAYSMAIMLHEYAEKTEYKGKLTVFATDAHGFALAHASKGIYEAERLKNISDERLSRYFIPEGIDRYQVIKQLRSSVVFASHNLLRDPPFTRIDLVSCRNLLIYLKSDAHAHVLALLNFALRPNGLLLLGSSEGVGRLASSFNTLHSAHKLYRKIREARPVLEFSGARASLPFQTPLHAWPAATRMTVPLDRQTLHDYDLLLKNNLPPSLLVDEGGQVLHYFGDVARYLKRPEGRVEANILRMIEGDLHVAVSLAFQRAKNSGASVRMPNTSMARQNMDQDGKEQAENIRIDVEVNVLADEKTESSHYHIIFSPLADNAGRQATAKPLPTLSATPELQSRLFELESELLATQQNLQVMADEAQNNREELLAANEEMQSANEELQSTNEELRSVNEELTTVNAESEKRNQELQGLNSDHSQLLNNLEVGVLFLDINLRIRKFNPASALLFNLLPQDIGRPIEHLAYQFLDDQLLTPHLETVIQTGQSLEEEVFTKNAHCYLQRVAPYKNGAGQVTGVVVAYTNISQLKAVKNRAQQYLNIAEVMLIAVDSDSRITLINRKGCEILGYTLEELEGKNWIELCASQAEADTLKAMQGRLVGQRSNQYDYCENNILTKNGEQRCIAWHSTVITDGSGRSVGTLSSGEDITERKKALLELQQSEEQFRTLTTLLPSGVYLTDQNGDCIYVNDRWQEMTGLSDEEAIGRSWMNGLHPDDYKHIKDSWRKLSYSDGDWGIEYRFLNRKTKAVTWVYGLAKRMTTINGQLTGYIGVNTDITARKKSEDALKASETKFRTLIENMQGAAYRCALDEDWTMAYLSPVIETISGYQADDFIGNKVRSYASIIYPEDQAMVDRIVRDSLEGKTPYVLEYRIVHADGSIRWIWERGCAIFSQAFNERESKVCYLDGVINDITQRKQTESQVLTLSQAVEQSPVMVMITGADANIEYVNQSFEDVTGYSAAEVKGKNPRFLQSGKTPLAHYQELWKALNAGRGWKGELHNRRKNGELYWERANVAPVIDDTGKTVHYLAVKEDITREKQQEEHIIYQAHYDALTKLPNRFLALDRLSQLIKEAQRAQTQVSLLYLDLDDFKKVNDTMGHDVGDQLLVQAAAKLLDAVRDVDTVARLGGDEFIVLISHSCNASEAEMVAETLLDRFERPFKLNDREIVLTASLGISVYPDDGDNSAELLRNADTAMYHSKEAGRNTYNYFTDDMNAGLSRRLALEEQLRGALERHEFFVCYQPLINIADQQLAGAEALLRWRNPILGDISPEEFIPIAEQTGLIVEIGQYVLTEAIAHAAQWQSDYSIPFKMAVNISPRQFRDMKLVPFIENLLQKAALSGASLELEITEGVLMSGHISLDKALTEISRLGIAIAMDDFGTGYSSLSYLRRYPFNTLKIDRSFVNDITKDPADRELVNASIAMAHGLGLKVVAEGVETEAQFDHLREQACDFAQGYLFSKPVPWQELITKYRA